MTDAVNPRFVELALALADAARPVVLRHFRTDLAVENKADASPVTLADRAAEAAMRAHIIEAFPDHGIYGEEHGVERGDAELVWVLDPIDGTRAYVSGVPLFGTLIALAHRGRPIVGVIDHAALGERWLGVAGQPTSYISDGSVPQAVRSRACASVERAILYATAPEMFRPPTSYEAYRRVADRAHVARYGTDCYAYGLVASGYGDLIVEGGTQPYDYMALVPVVEGAGGTITDWWGGALGFDSDGSVLAAGDARVHAAARGLLGDG